jgi:acyl-[acyl-carrier-protein]-phospholipid O-acyltransferase / long-chain-fatty-acid--[acyl-carrier-protein] ligase
MQLAFVPSMMTSVPTAAELDTLPSLPPRNKGSIGSVLLVQMLNAFGDNLVKMILVGMALAVSPKTELGQNMQVYLGIIFSLPYILLAPLAGYLSDRYSKRKVILWTQVAQLLVYVGFVGAVMLRDPQWTLWIALVLFFVLATQATFLSPAKSGVMKELAGSNRLGAVNGLLQMAMMAGILSGLAAGGLLFKYLIKLGYSPWDAVLLPLGGCMVLALFQIVAGWRMLPTAANPSLQKPAGLWVSHFSDLKAAFRIRAVGRAVSGTAFFWFVSYGLGSILFTVGKECFPDSAADSTEHASLLSAVLGAAVMMGGLLAGWICRKRLELGIVPLGGLGMASAMIATKFMAVNSPGMMVAMAIIGLCGGLFLVPLTTFVQDRSAPEERARVLSSANLLDCLIGGVGSNLIVKSLMAAGLTATSQIAFFGVAMLLGSLWISRLVPQDFVRFICLAIVRSIYKVKGFNVDSIPKEGPVLLLPNHVSYVDALILSSVCNRPVRFVIWDVLYRVWWLNGFLRLFGTVPISQTRAKDAIRTVADALNQGELVCLFPEGELTRTGEMNELQKGFELILRQSPTAKAVPVYLAGLWGSIFSWEGGAVFKKWPKKLRYPVQVHYGPALAVGEATTARVTNELKALREQANSPV